jgi:hypothetical protein
MTSENAAEVYGFDLGALQRIADEIGPTVEEMATPMSPDEIPRHSMCETFGDALERLVTTERPGTSDSHWTTL